MQWGFLNEIWNPKNMIVTVLVTISTNGREKSIHYLSVEPQIPLSSLSVK